MCRPAPVADGRCCRTRLHLALDVAACRGRRHEVGIGIYAGVLQALGLLDSLGQIADIGNDKVGQALAAAELPRHAHSKRRKKALQDD
jgi:hypothetical protein